MIRLAGAAARLTPKPVYLRYLGASGVALGVDLAIFLLLLGAHVPAAGASGIGYAAGIVAHWWLSSRAVFGGSVAAAGRARVTQQALFLLSAAVALAVTMGVVFGLDPRLAKIVAVIASFQAVWLLRRHIVFAR